MNLTFKENNLYLLHQGVTLCWLGSPITFGVLVGSNFLLPDSPNPSKMGLIAASISFIVISGFASNHAWMCSSRGTSIKGLPVSSSQKSAKLSDWNQYPCPSLAAPSCIIFIISFASASSANRFCGVVFGGLTPFILNGSGGLAKSISISCMACQSESKGGILIIGLSEN